MTLALTVPFLAAVPLFVAPFQEAPSREPMVLFGDLALPRTQALEVQAPRSEGGAWLGVSLGGEEGTVEVREVFPDSPAARANLRAGDVLLELDGEGLATYDELVAAVAKRKPGKKVSLLLRRDVEVDLADEYREGERYLLGVEIDEGENEEGVGVRLNGVQRGMPAARAGLHAGDVLLSIAGGEVRSGEDVRSRLTGLGEPHVSVRIERKLKVELGARPQEAGIAVQPAPPVPPVAPVEPRNPFERAEPGRLRDLLGRSAPQARMPGAGPQPDLERELRTLTEDIRALREEIAQLRAEVQRLRRTR